MRDDDPTDPTNFVIRGKARERNDYKLLPKKCWDILQAKYGGQEIVRHKDPDQFNRKFMIKFPAVKINIG